MNIIIIIIIIIIIKYINCTREHNAANDKH